MIGADEGEEESGRKGKGEGPEQVEGKAKEQRKMRMIIIIIVRQEDEEMYLINRAEQVRKINRDLSHGVGPGSVLDFP